MKTRTIIPKALHELFGEEQIKSELIITIGFAMVSSLALIIGTQEEWVGLVWYKIGLLFILLLDIWGGVAANLTDGTNRYYQKNPKKRWIFIAMHIQPLVFAWIFQIAYTAVFLVWAYTMGASITINLLQGKEYQRVLAGSLLGFGMMATVLLNDNFPDLITIIFALYMFKLIYGFAVDHQSHQKDSFSYPYHKTASSTETRELTN